MNSLRVKKNNIYRIEVNDNGDCIEFDVEDISLGAKCFRALDDISKLEKEYKEKIKDIKDGKEIAFMEENLFKNMREVMDSFLGENACQKIFGDRNYYNMYNDLFEELSKPRKELKGKSHLDMLKLSSKDVYNKVQNKYKKNKKKVI